MAKGTFFFSFFLAGAFFSTAAPSPAAAPAASFASLPAPPLAALAGFSAFSVFSARPPCGSPPGVPSPLSFASAIVSPSGAPRGPRPQLPLTLLADRGLLLPGHGLARPLAGARVGVRPLAAHRQVAPMAHAAVAADVDQPLDVHLDILAQVPF